jgi:hypothetical protein
MRLSSQQTTRADIDPERAGIPTMNHEMRYIKGRLCVVGSMIVSWISTMVCAIVSPSKIIVGSGDHANQEIHARSEQAAGTRFLLANAAS